MSQPQQPNHQTLSSEDRKKYDQIFMQVISSVQADVQQTQPLGPSPIAVMFHREQVSDVLQQMAVLIAAWNHDQIDLKALHKSAGILRALSLEGTATRIEALPKIDQIS